MKKLFRYFTPAEKALWLSSVLLILASARLFPGGGPLTLIASLTGVTSLLFNAKANPVGPLLMVVFSILYGIISFSARYYGEMFAYLGMTGPMSVLALISWVKNPYQGQRAQVHIARLSKRAAVLILLLTLLVTGLFYYILKACGMANLPLSTISVATSFLAVALTYLRSPLFALAYAANDGVLIALWLLAGDSGTWAVVVCFGVFLVNDSYTYYNWRRLQRRQEKG